MALPTIDVPIYELKLPSSGKEIRVRPFLVKEEKLLLMAAESKDADEIIRTTKQIINNCLIDDDVNIDSLPFFDIDYLFIALRAKSISETIEISFTCNNVVDEYRCGHMFDLDVDISKARIVTNSAIQNTIELSPEVSVKMKYPSYEIMKAINDNDTILNKKLKIIAHCIDMIVKKGKVYTAKDHTKDELVEFVENMTEEKYKKLERFIDNFPYFIVDLQHTCGKCGYEHKIEYTDFESFFY
jgi:hypothetical protein